MNTAIDRTTPLWATEAVDLTAGYRAGAFTPFDALEAIHGRIDAVNPSINAIIAEDRTAAREAARQSTARWRDNAPLSSLDGVPLTVKDNIFAAGLPASWGSTAYDGFQPIEDEPAVARLRGAGAIILGKTNVPEFTVQGYTSNALFGTTSNPLAPGRTPGGSTGGGAAAVAAGFGPLAIGTDGGGSLRRPAAHCGLFGLKPSLGQVARSGGFRQILADFETIGPVARSLADVRAAFAVLRGHDAYDPRSLTALVPPRPYAKAPRVGYFSHIGGAPVDRLIVETADSFAAALGERSFLVSAIPAPFDLELVNEVWSTIAAAGLSWEVEALGNKATDIGENARAMAARGRAVGLDAYLEAIAEVGAQRVGAAKLFDRFDLLLCPTTAALAWPADEPYPLEIDGHSAGPRGHAIFTGWMNVAGLCALSVPIASTPDGGGIGMQLVAAPGRDLDLLDFLTASRALDDLARPSFTQDLLLT
jgi:aspartyl-tRNA(Asn)/glutamyl-tRNA(Gln) amidotransferase subunit A